MKTVKSLAVVALLAGIASFTFVGCKSDGHNHQHHGAGAVKSYPLSKCIVSDDAFDHGKPVVFVYEGQEIKLCCKDCREDFDKDPAKFLSKLSGAK
jgi:hypothetical protein